MTKTTNNIHKRRATLQSVTLETNAGKHTATKNKMSRNDPWLETIVWNRGWGTTQHFE